MDTSVMDLEKLDAPALRHLIRLLAPAVEPAAMANALREVQNTQSAATEARAAASGALVQPKPTRGSKRGGPGGAQRTGAGKPKAAGSVGRAHEPSGLASEERLGHDQELR